MKVGMVVGDMIKLTIAGQAVEAKITRVNGTGAGPKSVGQALAEAGRPKPLDVHFKLGTRNVRIGDEVQVLPSAPRKQDGYRAIVKTVTFDGEGLVKDVTVVAAKDQGKRLKANMTGLRTYRPERLKAVNQRKGE